MPYYSPELREQIVKKMMPPNSQAVVAMNESERSAYCREHGLYVEQLDAWTQSFETMDPTG